MTATFEAILEWIREDGRGDMVKLVRQALELAQIGQRLDELESESRKTR